MDILANRFTCSSTKLFSMSSKLLGTRLHAETHRAAFIRCPSGKGQREGQKPRCLLSHFTSDVAAALAAARACCRKASFCNEGDLKKFCSQGGTWQPKCKEFAWMFNLHVTVAPHRQSIDPPCVKQPPVHREQVTNKSVFVLIPITVCHLNPQAHQKISRYEPLERPSRSLGMLLLGAHSVVWLSLGGARCRRVQGAQHCRARRCEHFQDKATLSAGCHQCIERSAHRAHTCTWPSLRILLFFIRFCSPQHDAHSTRPRNITFPQKLPCRKAYSDCCFDRKSFLRKGVCRQSHGGGHSILSL